MVHRMAASELAWWRSVGFFSKTPIARFLMEYDFSHGSRVLRSGRLSSKYQLGDIVLEGLPQMMSQYPEVHSVTEGRSFVGRMLFVMTFFCVCYFSDFPCSNILAESTDSSAKKPSEKTKGKKKKDDSSPSTFLYFTFFLLLFLLLLFLLLLFLLLLRNG